MPRQTPMFPITRLTDWTNDRIDSENNRAARRNSKNAPWPHHQLWLVFADRVEPANLSNYSTASEHATSAFSADDFRGLVSYVSHSNDYQVETTPGRLPLRTRALTFERAISLCRAQFDAGSAEQAKYDADPLYALQQELYGADWFYEFSDDYSVYNAGAAHFRKIQSLVDRTGAEGKAMFEEAREWNTTYKPRSA